MAHATSSDLLHRIERLERNNLALRLIALVVILLLGGLLLTGISSPKPPDVIEAKAIHLKDNSGKTRISIMAESALHAGPTIELYDPNGLSRVRISTIPYVASLITMNDHEGHSLLSLGTFDRGSFVTMNTSVTLDSGEPSNIISLNSDGTSHGLTIFSPDNKNHARLHVDNEGPSLRLQDSNKFQSVLGRVDTNNETTGQTRQTSAASLTLFGKDGKVMRQIP